MKATYVQKGENINYKNPTEDKITLGTLDYNWCDMCRCGG